MLLSQFALAETVTLDVDGMHCAGCKQMITASICDDPKVNATFEKCEVVKADEKSEKGQIVITTKGDSKVNVEEIKTAIAATGEDYKVSLAAPAGATADKKIETKPADKNKKKKKQ